MHEASPKEVCKALNSLAKTYSCSLEALIDSVSTHSYEVPVSHMILKQIQKPLVGEMQGSINKKFTYMYYYSTFYISKVHPNH